MLKKLISVSFSLCFMLTCFSSMVVQVEAAETSQIRNTYRNVMYYGDWSIEEEEDNFYPEDIPANLITHLNFAFLDFDSAGNLAFTDEFAALYSPLGQTDIKEKSVNAGILNALQVLKTTNPNLKVGISVGGWTKSGDFSEMAADPVSRKKFVGNIVQFVKYTNMDFVDIDWEYPNMPREADLIDSSKDEGTPHAKPEDKENYVSLLNDIRSELKRLEKETNKYYELSVALPAGAWAMGQGIDVAGIFEVVDFANMMTYDIHGVWEKQSGHHTALYTNPAANDPENGIWAWSADDTVTYLLNNGAPAEKIVIGAAFYTRGWGNVEAGENPTLPGLFQAADFSTVDSDGGQSRGAPNEKPLIKGNQGRNGGIWAFRSLDKLKTAVPDLTEYWDDIAKAPYLYSQATKQFYTFENEKSIAAKTDYIKEKNLGGMISWMQSQDKPSNAESKRRDMLTSAIKQGLFGNETLGGTTPINLPVDLSVTLDGKADAEGNEYYTVTIKNNEKLVETDTVLAGVEKSAKAIKLPILTITTSDEQQLSLKAGAPQTRSLTPILDVTENKATILAGESTTYQIYTDKVANVNTVEKIEIAQRNSTAGATYNSQTIYTKQGDVTATGTVTVSYLDENNKEIIPTLTLTGDLGTDFVVAEKEIPDYELVTKPDNLAGIYKNTPQTVTFSYKKVSETTATTSGTTTSTTIPKVAATNKPTPTSSKPSVLPKTGSDANRYLISLGMLCIVSTGLIIRRRQKQFES